MDTVTWTPEERASASRILARYRSDHRIVVTMYLGVERCATDRLRVYPIKGSRYRHDQRDIANLIDASYGGHWPTEEDFLETTAVEVARDIIREDVPLSSAEARQEIEEGRITVERRHERTGFDPDGLYGPTPCTLAGHIDGCPGKAGGDHELRPGWIAYDEDGHLIEVEVHA